MGNILYTRHRPRKGAVFAMRDPYAEVELQIARMLDYLVAVAGAESREQLGELY